MFIFPLYATHRDDLLCDPAMWLNRSFYSDANIMTAIVARFMKRNVNHEKHADELNRLSMDIAELPAGETVRSRIGKITIVIWRADRKSVDPVEIVLY